MNKGHWRWFNWSLDPVVFNQWKLMIWNSVDQSISKSKPIDNHMNLCHRLVIDYQYQSINWHRLLSIVINYRFYRLNNPGFVPVIWSSRKPICTCKYIRNKPIENKQFLHPFFNYSPLFFKPLKYSPFFRSKRHSCQPFTM